MAKAKKDTPIIDANRENWNKINAGEATPGEVIAAYEFLYAHRDDYARECGYMTVAQIRRYHNPWYAKKKPHLIESFVDYRLDQYTDLAANGNGMVEITYQAGETVHNGRLAILKKLTADELAAYATKRAEKIAAMMERRKAASAAHLAAIIRPETLTDFAAYLAHREIDVLGLNDVMLAQMDRLTWEKNRETIAKARAEAAQIKQVHMGDHGLTEPIKSWHGKHECDVWLVAIVGGRIAGPLFNELKNASWKLGGGWSSWSQAFSFKSEKSANEFSGLTNGGVDSMKHRARKEADRRNSAANHLAQYSLRNKLRATGALLADRMENTYRRVQMAARAEQNARDFIAFAEVIQSVATAIDTGNAQTLAGVRFVTQLSELMSALRYAWGKAVSEEAGRWMQDHERREVRPADMRYAEIPYPGGRLVDFVQIAKDIKGKRGMPGPRSIIEGMIKRTEEAGVQYVRPINAREGAAVVAAVEKLSLQYDWTWKEKIASYKRFVAIGITDVMVLRHTLRELASHFIAPEQADPVTVAERALVGLKIAGFFPTPIDGVADKMAEFLDPKPGEVGCEPSAGSGHLIEAVLAHCPDARIGYYEISYNLRELLTLKFGDVANVFDAGFDFIDGDKRFNWYSMNPPFENGKDEEHVKEAYGKLLDGGRIAAIVSQATARRARFTEWLDEVGGWVEKELPAGTFRDAGTMVPAAMIFIQK